LSGLSRSECLKKRPKVFFVRAPAAGSGPIPFAMIGSPGTLKIALPLWPYSFFGLLSCAGSHPKCPAAPPEAPNHGLRSSKCSGWSFKAIRDLILHLLKFTFEVPKPTSDSRNDFLRSQNRLRIPEMIPFRWSGWRLKLFYPLHEKLCPTAPDRTSKCSGRSIITRYPVGPEAPNRFTGGPDTYAPITEHAPRRSHNLPEAEKTSSFPHGDAHSNPFRHKVSFVSGAFSHRSRPDLEVLWMVYRHQVPCGT